MDRQGKRKAGKGMLTVGKMGGIICALWLVGCGEVVVSPQAEDEPLYGSERESEMGESHAVLQSEENPGESPQPETAAQENPYESSGYELMDEEGVGAYLKSLGMEDVSPICYYDPEGAPKLELYYDPERELGCGYWNYPGETLIDMDGFMFKGCMEIDCKENDPYGVFAMYEGDSMDEIYLGNLPPEKLLDAFLHESLYVCEYDGERLMRIWMYGTGSDTERFFIYDGDSDMPSYCLNLVYGVTHGATLFQFVY